MSSLWAIVYTQKVHFFFSPERAKAIAQGIALCSKNGYKSPERAKAKSNKTQCFRPFRAG